MKQRKLILCLLIGINACSVEPPQASGNHTGKGIVITSPSLSSSPGTIPSAVIDPGSQTSGPIASVTPLPVTENTPVPALSNSPVPSPASTAQVNSGGSVSSGGNNNPVPATTATPTPSPAGTATPKPTPTPAPVNNDPNKIRGSISN